MRRVIREGDPGDFYMKVIAKKFRGVWHYGVITGVRYECVLEEYRRGDPVAQLFSEDGDTVDLLAFRGSTPIVDADGEARLVTVPEGDDLFAQQINRMKAHRLYREPNPNKKAPPSCFLLRHVHPYTHTHTLTLTLTLALTATHPHTLVVHGLRGRWPPAPWRRPISVGWERIRCVGGRAVDFKDHLEKLLDDVRPWALRGSWPTSAASLRNGDKPRLHRGGGGGGEDGETSRDNSFVYKMLKQVPDADPPATVSTG
eukprot:jgi/Tetstr1/420305/TSEL_011426.t1